MAYTFMEIMGLLLATLIGLSLGMIGGGGSILTVPVLVYVLGQNPIIATSYSLFIVGATSFIGAINYFKNKLIDVKASIAFALPSFLTVLLTRKLVLPAIPTEIFHYGNFALTKETLIMITFALLMLSSSSSMIRQQQIFLKMRNKIAEDKKTNYPFIFLQGIIVGALTGFVGAGGGFLIIPALVLFGGLAMKTAIGTSLLIIAINSLIGFAGDIARGTEMDWPLILSFTGIAMAGILIGSYLSNYIESNRLKPIFGWFTLAMGIFIILKEIFI